MQGRTSVWPTPRDRAWWSLRVPTSTSKVGRPTGDGGGIT